MPITPPMPIPAPIPICQYKYQYQYQHQYQYTNTNNNTNTKTDLQIQITLPTPIYQYHYQYRCQYQYQYRGSVHGEMDRTRLVWNGVPVVVVRGWPHRMKKQGGCTPKCHSTKIPTSRVSRSFRRCRCWLWTGSHRRHWSPRWRRNPPRRCRRWRRRWRRWWCW